MRMRDQYRRESDKDSRLLILLDERVAEMQKSLASLVSKQTDNPCATHELRIKFLERIMYFVISAVFLLMLRAGFSFFTSLNLG